MRPVELVLPDAAMPRTVYYDRLCEAVLRHPWHRPSGGRLLIPAEDTAQETNWPRYGARDTAYLRGGPPSLAPGQPFLTYLNALAARARAEPANRLLVVNMHPFVRLPMALKPVPNALVADGCLAACERAANPRTISMPALPIVKPAAMPARDRPILASFQGAPSHAVRQALAGIDNGGDIVVRLIDPKNHMGKIDAVAGRTDESYEALLDRSVFSFVPRGDALFSYRLLEVMARGSIPVILSDGWVLPFDRTVDWPSISVSVHQDAVPRIPEILRSFTPEEIDRMQTKLQSAYAAHFADLDRIVDTLLREADRIGL